MTEPRMLYLTGQLTRGGAEQQLYYLLAHMEPPVTVISFSSGGYWVEPIRELGHNVIELERRGHKDIRRLWQVTQLIRANRPDIVHLFIDSVSGLYGRLGALLAGHHRVVVGERNHPTHHPGWYRTAQPWLNRTVRAVVCNSYLARDYMLEQHLISPKKVHVIPNGLEASRFDPPEPPGQWPWPENWHGKTILGMVARLAYSKNPQAFVQMAAHIHQQQPEARFVLVGDGPLRADIQALIDSLSLNDVVLLAGERHDVPALLHTMDIFVLPSRYEGMPNVVMEAMAAGLPCVATDVGDCGRVVVEQETGYLVPAGDIPALAERAVTLINDPDLRQQMGQRGQARMRSEYSINVMVARYKELYTQLMNE